MSFSIKTWYDRVVEHAGRKTLTNVDTGEETVVDMTRNDGEVTQAGDAFSATNMNDLETRVSEAFDDVDTTISKVKSITTDEFSEASAYSSGDYCIYNNVLYKFTAEKASGGVWNSSIVEATTVATEIATNATAISQLNENLQMYYIGYTSVTAKGENLNDYNVPGVYIFDSSNAPTNIPAGSNGHLLVIGRGSYARQIWFRIGTIGANENQVFTRLINTSSGTYGSWYQFDVTAI